MIEPIILFPLLFLTGFIAGTIDAVAGGGGLITLPVLLGAGFPPQLALGTNKFQSTFGSCTASLYYWRNDNSLHRETKWIAFFTFLGAFAGTIVVQRIDNSLLANIIPFLLLGIFLYTLFSPSIGLKKEHPRMSVFSFGIIFGITLGFYDGFLGPGTGSFWTFVLIFFLGMNLPTATGKTKMMNFVSNIVSLSVFLWNGSVWFFAGGVMAAGQILGARYGAKLVIANGTRFIRPVFLTMVFFTILKLLWSTFF
jgi:uncharacterized membrane protein YfcA